MSENNQIALRQERENLPVSGVYGSMQGFEDAQRMAKALAASSLVPQDYQNNTANTLIALEMAQRTGSSPMAVMQNMHVIHGRPSWSSQFVIAALNSCGRFSPLRYKVEGTGDDETCTAWTTDRSGEVLEGPPVSIGMAKAEGWYSKNGSKWKTMPQLMLRYRAAKFFGNLYAPDVLMGMHTAEEVEDFSDAPPRAPRHEPVGANDNRPAQAATVNDLNEFAATQPAASAVVIEGELVEPETLPAAAPASRERSRQRRNQQQAEPQPETAPASDPAPEVEQQAQDPVEPETQPQDTAPEQQATAGGVELF